jgi:hypothetical protein
MLVVLTACSQNVPTVVAPTGPDALTAPALLTATPPPPTAVPSPAPTGTVLTMLAYGHSSRVFALNLPEGWEVLDDSNEQRIVVRLLPPLGYGSRATVEVTNEGPLTPEEVRQLAESYLRLNYVQIPGYTEVSRSELPDGRLQFVYLYDDHRGATGRETLTVQQVGPYFAALRLYLSDRETSALGSTLDAIAASFTVDPLAGWGSTVAAINPAELRVVSALLWRDRAGITHYSGEVYNASPADVAAVQVTVAFCDAGGIVMAEVTQGVGVKVIQRGGSGAFGISVEDLPDDVAVCSEQPSAEPARADPSYTTALSLDASVSYHQWRRDLTFEGPITNFSLSPVDRVQVIMVSYDAENRVIGYAEAPLDPTVVLLPGQSYDFSYVIPALGGQPDHVVTLVEAHVQTAGSHSLVPAPTP